MKTDVEALCKNTWIIPQKDLLPRDIRHMSEKTCWIWIIFLNDDDLG